MTFASNPFSTRFWTPGALPFSFDADETDLDLLLERFFDLRNRFGIVQIVGPHGSGKTTLLEELDRAFRKQKLSVVRETLGSERRKMGSDFLPKSDRPQSVYLLDGYEQLSLFDAVLLRSRKWKRSAGLILTTHRPAYRIPILYRTVSRFERFCRIVEQLTQGTPYIFNETMLRKTFDRHERNFRNAFFELYDRCQEIEASLDV